MHDREARHDKKDKKEKDEKTIVKDKYIHYRIEEFVLVAQGIDL